LAVEVDGRRVPTIPGFKARSLFAYLLLYPGPHPRIRLAGRFWPEVNDASALASLRVALWAVRRALEAAGGTAHLTADRLTAGLATDLPYEVDVQQFDRLVTAGDPLSLATAVALYRGPVLADLPDEWVLDVQDEYRVRVSDACEHLGDEAEASGDLAAAANWARRALAHEPARETCHRALISRLAASGRAGEALAAYRKCATVLEAEFGVEPAAETQDLARRIRARSGSAPPPGRRPPGVVARTPMVGRSKEIGDLEARFRAAVDGSAPQFLLITGEGGIGKTRLVAELAARVAARGGRCASGSGSELTGGPPFAAWSEVLRELVAQTALPPEGVTWAADIARLVPSVTTVWGRPPSVPSPAPELERARLFEAIAELLAWSARDKPLLIILDDLHLADAASLAVLGFIGRRLHGLRVLVAGTRRPLPPNADLEAVLEGMRRHAVLAGELELGPLDDAAVRTIAIASAPGIDATAADRIVAGSGGNPLLARESARAVAAGQHPFEGLRALVRGPLRRLTPAARLLVDVATVVARPLEPAEAADLVGVDALIDALGADTLGELLDVAGDRRIRFTHSLLRDACHRELSPVRLARLHALIADVLGRRPGRSAAEVARHHRLAGDDRAALGYLMIAAGDARGLGALDDAAALLREASALAGGDAAVATEVWLALADVEAWRGRRSAWEEAVGNATTLLSASGDFLAIAEAHASRGRWLHTVLCYPREALTAYRAALDLLDEHVLEAPELRAVALAGAAWCEAMAGDATRVEALAAASEAVVEVVGDALLGAELALARGAALARSGRMAMAEGPYTRAAELAQGAGRPDLARVALSNAAATAACRGDFQQALELAHRGQRCESGGLYEDLVCHGGVAHALSRLGCHREALAAAEIEAALAARSGGSEHEAMADYDLGTVALAAGDAERAVERLAAALNMPNTRFFSRPLARLLLAEARLVSGDPSGAAAELDAIPFEPVGPGDLPDTLVARLVRLEGLLAAERGDVDHALHRLGEAERLWRRRLDEASATGDAFAASLVDLGRPPVAGLVEPALEVGRVLADRARTLATAGRLAEAAVVATEASAIADTLGFEGYRAAITSLVAAGSP
jgi:DNA-binding SARP family transcriptional activator